MAGRGGEAGRADGLPRGLRWKRRLFGRPCRSYSRIAPSAESRCASCPRRSPTACPGSRPILTAWSSELRETNEIAPQEKLCYLGRGCFGILEFRPPGGPSRFVIKRRIQYEEKEAPQDWKKPLQITC